MAIYKPYIKKSNDTVEELPLYATTAGEVVNLGYYDTITTNDDGTYTITKQTGYLTINTEDITRGSNETVNSANAYVYAYNSKKVSNALYDWDGIIGISNNGFEVKCVDSSWVGANKISINSTANQICIGFSAAKSQAEIQALCPIYIQYKLATATTEKVEKNHYARYNQNFILEHNKSEAERSANLWSGVSTFTNTNNDHTYLGIFKANKNTVYTLSMSITGQRVYYSIGISSGWLEIGNSSVTFNSGDSESLDFNIYNSTSKTSTATSIMINEGPVALPYQPYSGAPIHKKEFEDFKNSMKFIPYVSVSETSTSKDISENGTYFVIPTEPANATIKLEVKATDRGQLQTAYFSGGIISVLRFYDSRLKTCIVTITYGAGTDSSSTYISDSYNPVGSSSGMISRITGKCKIYKLI